MSDNPKEQVYDAAISPLMTQIIALCKKHKINMAANFALDSDEEGYPLYCSTTLDVDDDDKKGIEMVRAAHRLFKPRPLFAAITIISPKAK